MVEPCIDMETISYLNGILLDSVDCYKDLSILFDTGLKFHQHASEAVMKANRILACMRRGFINLNESILLQLYKSMVHDQPLLEYGNLRNLGTPLCIRSTQTWERTCTTVCNKTRTVFKRLVIHWSIDNIEFTIPVTYI